MEMIAEIAQRIQALRDIYEFTVEEMAEVTGCSVDEYKLAEAGKMDFSFTFIYKCAEKLLVCARRCERSVDDEI